jgi:hypothetical protein
MPLVACSHTHRMFVRQANLNEHNYIPFLAFSLGILEIPRFRGIVQKSRNSAEISLNREIQFKSRNLNFGKVISSLFSPLNSQKDTFV